LFPPKISFELLDFILHQFFLLLQKIYNYYSQVWGYSYKNLLYLGKIMNTWNIFKMLVAGKNYR